MVQKITTNNLFFQVMSMLLSGTTGLCLQVNDYLAEFLNLLVTTPSMTPRQEFICRIICKVVDKFEPHDENKKRTTREKIGVFNEVAVVNGLPMPGGMEILLFIISLVHQHDYLVFACEMGAYELTATVSTLI